jgi:hypothetical protein
VFSHENRRHVAAGAETAVSHGESQPLDAVLDGDSQPLGAVSDGEWWACSRARSAGPPGKVKTTEGK